MPFVYILECADGSYYVGSTWDLERRVGEHNEGLGAEYTKRRRPVRLVWSEQLARIDEAYWVEKQIQGWGRAKRQALIDGRLADLPALARTAKDREGPRRTARIDRARGLDKLDRRRHTMSGALTRASSASWSVSFSCD